MGRAARGGGCARCEADPRPFGGGSDPRKCAFPDGVFTTENWNCGTLARLRWLADEHPESQGHNEDQHVFTFPLADSCGFLVLSWYKSRGRTEGAWILDSEKMKPLTLADAETIIAQSCPEPAKKRTLPARPSRSPAPGGKHG